MTERPTISAVIVSCNEADVIEQCLQSVVSWVDEIVVVDMYSTDGTREIVQRYLARLLDHQRLTYADPARNFAFAQASSDWILMLDPDERVPMRLAQALQRIARHNAVDVVTIPRRSVIFGRVVQSPGVSDTTVHPRFFRYGVLDWPSEVHTLPNLAGLLCHNIPEQGDDMAIHHDTFRSIPMLLDKILRYGPKEVEKLQSGGMQFSLGAMLYAACAQFVYRMVLGRAYEDGMPGLLAVLYFSFCQVIVHAELWEAEGRSSRWDRQIVQWGRWTTWPFRTGIAVIRVAARLTGLLHASRD